jgi:hypothetical protein
LNSDNHSIHHHCPQTSQENPLDGLPFVSSGDIYRAAQITAPGLVGSDPTANDYVALEARWIDRALADHAGLRRVDSLTGSEIIDRKSGNYAGILIPYFRPGCRHVRDYRPRRDRPTSNTIRPAISNQSKIPQSSRSFQHALPRAGN